MIIVVIAVNGGQPSDPLTAYQRDSGDYLLSRESLASLHLQVPARLAAQMGATDWYALNDIIGARVHLDAGTQILAVDVPAQAFIAAVYDQRRADIRVPEASTIGGFLNYDVLYQKQSQQSQLSGLVEAGAFFGGGTLTSRTLGRDVWTDAAHGVSGPAGNSRSVFRLDTQYVRDFPESTATMVIGDAVSGASSWSRAMYFGGLQWRTNYGTRPDIQPVPLPSMSGSAAVPSTVDLYVDNVLRQRQAVDAGPFTLSNIPAYSGQGNVTLVVRDALGRQQVFVQNYITSPALLRAGSMSESFEIGALHNNFGQPSARYGQGFASATARYGVGDTHTVEGHAEASAHLAAAGLGGTVALSNVGVLTVGAAASGSGAGQGGLGYLQFNHQSARAGFSLRTQVASAQFRELGESNASGNAGGEPKSQTQAQASFSVDATTTFLVGATLQTHRNTVGNTAGNAAGNTSDFRSVNYGLNLSFNHLGSLFAGLIQSFAPARAIAANLIWTVPLEDQRFVQFTTSRQNGARQSTAEFDQAPPAELGWGYRLRRALGNPAGSDAGATWRAAIGEYSLAASNVGGPSSLLGEVRGGIAALGGHVVATKWLDQSFALVTVPTSEAIDIYANNVKVGHTNADGVGFVPNLVAYENNHVALDPNGVPLKLTLELATRDVTPRSRTGVVLAFEAHNDQGATIRLVHADGSPVANGATVTVSQQSGTAQIALRGEVFFQNIAFPAHLTVADPAGPCTADIPALLTNDPFPVLGPVICQPVRP